MRNLIEEYGSVILTCFGALVGVGMVSYVVHAAQSMVLNLFVELM